MSSYATVLIKDSSIKYTIEDDLIKKVSKFTNIKEKTSLVRLGLEILIARESSKRLSKLGGTEKKLRVMQRRRPNY